jgi:hypothetical protein
VRRVRALRCPPPASGRRHLAASAVAAVVCVVAAVFATADFVSVLGAWLG